MSIDKIPVKVVPGISGFSIVQTSRRDIEANIRYNMTQLTPQELNAILMKKIESIQIIAMTYGSKAPFEGKNENQTAALDSIASITQNILSGDLT